MSENQYIEQYMILAKGQKAKALETIIEQVLSHQNIFVFGEFLQLANIQEISQDSKHYKTLQLFAFDTYQQYKSAAPSTYIDLKPNQIKKLKMITIADLASKSQDLDYQQLMKVLDISNLRELEDLIIDCIYNDLLKGQLDQRNGQVHVEGTYGRDVRDEDVGEMIKKLEAWDKQLEQAQHVIQKQINGCNQSVVDGYEKQLKLETELNERRDELLKRLTEGGDEGESRGGGPQSMGRQGSSNSNASNKRGDHNWGGGLLSQLKSGFLNKQ